VTLGLLRPDEVRRVFRYYVGRLMDQRALAAGGPRYGLDGEPVGEVTADQMASGKSAVTAIEAKRARKAKAIAKGAVRQATKAPIQPKTPREVQSAPSVASMKPGRLGLADLKAAARARWEADAGAPLGAER
jgi:sRNA-binding protein